MPEPQDRSFDAHGLRLHYLEWGEPGAPLVVLQHGSSAHAHWWDLFAPEVADRFHLVAPDLRGHGDSAHAQPPDYTLESYAGDIAALVQRLGSPSVRVVGHSLGALVAAVFAASSPVPVASLALIDVRLRGKRAGERPFLDRLRQFPHPVYASREEAVRRFRLLPTGTAAAPEVLAHVALHALRETGDGRFTLKFDRETLRDQIARDVSPELLSLRCPILYVRGSRSVLASARAADEVRALLPNAQIAEVEDAYHHVMLDNPGGFARALSRFLTEF
jgi:pimeloyl-ACP methyl ester carboxylesterase